MTGALVSFMLAAVAPTPQGVGSSVVTNGVDGVGAVAAQNKAAPAAAAPARPVGWPESGEVALSFVAARKKLAVKLVKRGWRHVHTIELGKDRKLESWDRGGEELTLMTWRIGTGRTGYSLGITRKSGK